LPSRPPNVSAATLARIGIMTLDHGSIIKLPWPPPFASSTTPSSGTCLTKV
jgi:hypothetical protein